MTAAGHRVVKHLDGPARFLLWRADSAAAAAAGFAAGIIAGSALAGFILSAAAAALWIRLRSGAAPGWIIHLAWWHLPLGIFRRTPSSALRHFAG